MAASPLTATTPGLLMARRRRLTPWAVSLGSASGRYRRSANPPSVVPELQAHHAGVAGVQLVRQPRHAAAGRYVVHTLGHLGSVFAEPGGVPAQGAATPPVAVVEAAGHQLAAYPRSRVRGLPVRVVAAVPVSGLGVSGPVGADLQLRAANPPTTRAAGPSRRSACTGSAASGSPAGGSGYIPRARPAARGRGPGGIRCGWSAAGLAPN